MEAVPLIVMIFGPAVVAMVAAGGAVWMFHALEWQKNTAGKALMWCGIVACSLVAFGIGTCYAMMLG